eukprot:TRINITY_DN3213_c0_g1_i1.p1 TRINITY_DN3213_c0_g1~~TRINITY_DN3213_c0_g1_i1.p1  ORF type:complete len:432 (+),score=152.51 TRINITY_DN3213_c0_g1_i1:185-1480(+)
MDSENPKHNGFRCFLFSDNFSRLDSLDSDSSWVGTVSYHVDVAGTNTMDEGSSSSSSSNGAGSSSLDESPVVVPKFNVDTERSDIVERANKIAMGNSLMLTKEMGESLAESVYIDKGLTNYWGQNNCFVNVVIQALWHLSSFSRRFEKISEDDHVHNKEACVFCALKFIFNEYHFGSRDVAPPDRLRYCLHALFSGEKKFQIGKMDDASEAFSAIMEHLHNEFVGNEDPEKDVDCLPPCVVHNVFGIDMCEQYECATCGEALEPNTYKQFIQYVGVQELLEKAKENKGADLGKLMGMCMDETEKSCDTEGCEAKNVPKKWLVSSPYVYTVGLIWTTSTPSKNEIMDVMELVGGSFDIGDIYPGAEGTYQMRGLVSIYGLHYTSYFYRPRQHRWLVFDDTIHREVGRDWESIQRRALYGRLQPAMLFFEKTG